MGYNFSPEAEEEAKDMLKDVKGWVKRQESNR